MRKQKNKYEWTYLFRWKTRQGNHEYFTYRTDEGLQVAEEQAYNHLLWDGGMTWSLKLLGKHRGGYSDYAIKW